MNGDLSQNRKFVNSIIFLGKRSDENELMFSAKPGFFDALSLSEQPAPSHLYHFISLDHAANETFHFHDPNLSKKLTLTFHHRSLNVTESGPLLTTGAVYNIFNHFLIKRGSRILFLTKNPNLKIKTRRRKTALVHTAQKKLEE